MSAAPELVALASLPSMYPARLRRLLRLAEPHRLLALLREGGPFPAGTKRAVRGDGLQRLSAEARAIDPDVLVASCRKLGAETLARTDDRYPRPLADDAEAPELIFVQGDPKLLTYRRVGVVGTRNATAAGVATAEQLGRELAAAGVCVISGLARGIDAAVHRGVRSAGGAAVAVVGSGLDVPYPKRNAALWSWVASEGCLISEWPPGAAPEGWRFPLRNRLIAAMSEVLVVVESRERGGSLITARAAVDRGVDVLAVPGSVHCRAAAGTNRLIDDGAGVVLSTTNVLDALSLAHGYTGQLELEMPDAEPVGLAGDIVEACRQRPSTLDEIATALSADPLEVARTVGQLERDGWLRDAAGWFETVASRLAPMM